MYSYVYKNIFNHFYTVFCIAATLRLFNPNFLTNSYILYPVISSYITVIQTQLLQLRCQAS